MTKRYYNPDSQDICYTFGAAFFKIIAQQSVNWTDPVFNLIKPQKQVDADGNLVAYYLSTRIKMTGLGDYQGPFSALPQNVVYRASLKDLDAADVVEID